MQEINAPELKSNHKPKAGFYQNRENTKIREYIDHVENGISLRTIAKRDGVHPSTVLRRIRKIENKRELAPKSGVLITLDTYKF